jgi:serine protease Do
MNKKRTLVVLGAGCAAMLAASCVDVHGKDLAQLEQEAFNAAARSVAECVVQIRTVGGLDRLDNQVLAQGPTTGLIVSRDGYIVSSAFNFAQRPASILVRLSGGEQRPAELIGRDTGCMLVLLKVDAEQPLPTPTPAALDDVHVGDWAVAVGRTYDAERVNVSVGVVSALNRMHGRALQTDANASVANYGGPLVDLYGRVLGVLVPMAPQTGAAETNELAGAEFYDSGIAFAVPLEHILGVLDRWIEQQDLNRGLLGVGMTDGNPHSTPPIVTAVWPRSPAAEAGWQPDDRIIAVDGEPVESQTQLRFHITPRYAGDEVKVTLRRGKGDNAEEIDTHITLAAELPPYRHAFLGVLPQRAIAGEGADDESSTSGIAVRAVWPDSPADVAGFERGDRITHLGDDKVNSLAEVFAKLNAKNPGDKLAVKSLRGEETMEFSIELAELPTGILSSADLPPLQPGESEGENGDDGGTDEAPPKLAELKLPELPQSARYYRPPGEGPALGLLVWLGDGREETCQSLAAAWRQACDRDRQILLMPAPAEAKGWATDDMEFVVRLLSAAAGRFDADPHRIVVAGEGQAGQFAYALAFKARKLIRGVAVVDSPLPRTLELPPNSPGERLAVLSVETENAPLSLLIRRDLQKLGEVGYPATQIVRRGEAADAGQLDAATRATIARWIDGLDRF